jgi:hypothetical protein
MAEPPAHNRQVPGSSPGRPKEVKYDMKDWKTVTISMSQKFLKHLKLNCQAKNMFPEMNKKQTTAMECLGLLVMLLGNDAPDEQIKELLPDEWHGEIGSPMKKGEFPWL